MGAPTIKLKITYNDGARQEFPVTENQITAIMGSLHQRSSDDLFWFRYGTGSSQIGAINPREVKLVETILPGE